MKIVHFGKYYPPETGGIESVTASLARGSLARGHDVSVVCFHRLRGLAPRADDCGVRLLRHSALRAIKSQPLSFRYVLSCWQQAREAEIVHIHCPNLLGSLCVLLLGRRPKIVVHWHSDVLNKGLLGWLVRPLERAMLARAHRVVGTSEAYLRGSPMLAEHLGRSTVVPIGVPEPASDMPSSLPSALASQIAGRRVVLAVGRLVPYKGFDVLVAAAARLSPDAVVVIAGGGPQQDALAVEIARLGLHERVILAGRVDDAALNALFAQASMLCMSSTYRAEAFGVVLLEAMSRGLPVVAADIPGSGVGWVNQHDVSGLNVPVNDPVALAQACQSILDSDQLRARLAKGARQRYLDEFTEAQSVERMLQVYKSLLHT
jgi:glycosyltransferase involved in cell wall biosynthesis